MPTPPSADTLHRVFGPDAFAPALFYAHEPALRFELSRSGPPIDLFAQAFDRAREIAGYVFRDSSSPTAVLSWFGEGPPLRHREVFRSVRDCGIDLARPRACWTETHEESWGPEPRTLVAFSCGREMLDRLLWGALAADLGIRPRLLARVHLADPERGVMLHPYDDRGMDVIGPNAELLSDLFHRFHDRLLPYDLPRMESFFASPRD